MDSDVPFLHGRFDGVWSRRPNAGDGFLWGDFGFNQQLLEAVSFLPLDHQPESCPLPQQDLDPVAPSVAEDKYGRRKRIQPQRLLNQ